MMVSGAKESLAPSGEDALVLNDFNLPLLLGAFGACWLLFLAWCALTPPIDNIEQLVWVSSLEWGYFKHPPLPTWILAAASVVLPQGPALTFTLGAVFVLGAHAIFWVWLREMHGPRTATILLLASLCITFYNQRVHYYNHNVVMMPPIAVCILMMWRLTQRARWSAWIAIGVAMGLGMLVKYQMALIGICIGLWWLRMRWWRDPVNRWGLVLATGIASAIFLPHLIWLIYHDWAPLRYAETSSLGMSLSMAARLSDSMSWTTDWVLNRQMPAWMVMGSALGWAVWRTRKSRNPAQEGPAHSAPGSTSAASWGASPPTYWREFSLLWGVFPLLFMLSLGLGLGVEMQNHWGTAFGLWMLPAALALAPSSLKYLNTCTAVRAAWVAFALIQALIVLQFWATSPQGIERLKTQHWQHFPSQAMAESLAPQARKALGGPIDIIAGRSAIAGSLALHLPEHPKVLINGDLATSPWISAEELRTARVVEVFPARELPEGAQWFSGGWAWRVGVSPLARLQGKDLPALPQAPAK
ncbi:ArnT family glycosyltransferase [Ottowia thiooxydans]|uniref:4-amino-4-deoxy-L-arabinose transferase-like glycosyltransferase n=1 Tax=Ottowia thiooxydans TaxID=219182 RepID=A0ABV2Q7C1_9BURK